MAASDLIDSKRVVNTLTRPPAQSPTLPPTPTRTRPGFECIPRSTCATRSHQRQRRRRSHHIRISIQHVCLPQVAPLHLPGLCFFRACPYSTSSLSLSLPLATFRIQNISDKLASLSATCDKMQRKQKAAPSTYCSPLPAPPAIPTQALSLAGQCNDIHSTYSSSGSSKCPSLIYAKTLPQRR